ncbi:MAG: DUF1697 domain-containing protein, partial [Acidobacteriaceae bacterium]|nr:DUF1697 domain-containing protein [Acidobacteriaceae bacterium]
MGVIVSMLRGVNLGPHNRIKMEALRALYESLQLRDVQTYVQSGNVVFRTKQRDVAVLAKRIEDAIELNFGFHSAVILRTAAELKRVNARNPFATRLELDPGKLIVTFLDSDPGQEARDSAMRIKADPEELRIENRELYIYFPNGMGRSKLQLAVIEKMLKCSGTSRNWN